MKIFSHLLLLTLGWLPYIFSEAPKACLYNCKDAIVLVINKNSIDDTGAWISFFSLGLEQTRGESFLDLPKVDYKIEDNKLSRYTASYGNTWTHLTLLERYNLGPWQAVRIPKHHLLNPDSPIEWRVALFPKGHSKVLKLPKRGPGKLDPYQSLELKSYKGLGIPLDVALAAAYEKKLEVPAFVSGDRFDTPIFNKPDFKHEITQNLDQLIEPQTQTIFVGNTYTGPKPISEEVADAHRLSNSTKSCLYDIPKLKTKIQNIWLNQARSTAAHMVNISPFFVQNFQNPLPRNAMGGIYRWKGELQSIFEHIELQRKSFSGPLWYYFHPKQQNWSSKLLEASQKIWTSFQILPMLTPEYSFEKSHHKLFTDVLWQKHCTLHSDYSPKPESLKKLKSLKNMSPSTYLRKVVDTFQNYRNQ